MTLPPDATKAPTAEVNSKVFDAWKEYQVVAMHFNDLLMRLRSQSLAAVAGLSAVAAVVIKAGIEPALQWGALAGAFLFLALFWTAIWILDFSYYNRLLIGAVDALIEIEKAPAGEGLNSLVLSTRIEALVARRQKPVNGRLGGERARWFFYIIVFATLAMGFTVAGSKAGWFTRDESNSHWFVVDDAKSKVGYTSEAFLAELPLPPIDRLSIRAKFVRSPTDQRSHALGYVVDVAIDPFDQKRIPAKYLQESIVGETAMGPVKTGLLEHVTYSVRFSFSFLDADGFVLARVEGTDVAVASGRSDHIQRLIDSKVQSDIVSRTARIDATTLIVKCESCR